MAAEDRNITLDGERQIAIDLTLAWSGQSLDGELVAADCYRAAFERLLDPAVTGDSRTAAFNAVRRWSPLVRARAGDVIHLNLANMRPIDGRAKQMADRAVAVMVAGAVVGTLLAVAFTLLAARSILRPLATVMSSIREIGQGNLDLVVQVRSRDEFHQLAEAFNAMTAKLREYRRTNRAKLVRTQQTTQLAVNSLHRRGGRHGAGRDDRVVERRRPAAVPAGAGGGGGRSRRSAAGRRVPGGGRVGPAEQAAGVRVGRGGVRRRRAAAVLPAARRADHRRRRAPVGVTLVLADVTNLRRLDEMKSGLLSVVSHELKTPLTSIRMAVHLLAEERVGPLTAKQSELVTAAREDSDRLDRIIADLLDMGRMESGRAGLDLRPARPEQLVEAAAAPLRAAFHDKSIGLSVDVPADLPAVAVDPGRVGPRVHQPADQRDEVHRPRRAGDRVGRGRR